MNPLMKFAIVKAIRTDYIKRTISITLEAQVPNFPENDRSQLSGWAVLDICVDCEFCRTPPLKRPLLKDIDEITLHQEPQL